MADVGVADMGTIWRITGLTPEGVEWMKENIAGEPWMATNTTRTVMADHRPARDIVTGMLDAGLSVTLDGAPIELKGE